MVDLPAKLNPKLDKLRALKAGKLQAEPYTVFMRTRVFSNNLADGYQSETIVQLMTDGVAAPIKVVHQRDIGLGNGKFQDHNLMVTLTPDFGTGGYDVSLFDPPTNAPTTREIVFIVKGPNLPTNGAIYAKVKTEVSAFAIKLTLRNTGASP